MSDDRIERLAEIGNAALRRRRTRRQALKGAAGLGLAVPILGAAARPRRTSAQDVVTITWFAGRDTTGYTPKQVEAFNAAHPNIQISYQEQGAVTTDLHDKFVTIATAEDPSADLISMDVPFVPEFAAAGWTLPVDDLLPAEERGAFFAGTIEGATYDGQLYAVPWFNNGPGLFYRKDLLDGAGLQPPKTYDELLAAAQQLQTPEINGYIFQAAQTEGGLIHWLEYLWGYGGDLVDEEMSVVVDQGTAGVDSMTRLLDYIYNDKISPESTLTMKTGADAENVFAEGRAVFLRQWMTATAAMEADTSQVKGKWDVAPLPSQDGAAAGPGCLGTWNLGISKFSRYPEETAEAIRWLTSLEQQTARYLGGGFLPARSAVFDDPAVKEKYAFVDRLRSAFEALKPRPVTPYYSQMSADVLQPNFGAAITRQKEPAQAIADMAEGLEQILAG
jgi:multiple sugar transport system substrate-binding protein